MNLVVSLCYVKNNEKCIDKNQSEPAIYAKIKLENIVKKRSNLFNGQLFSNSDN